MDNKKLKLDKVFFQINYKNGYTLLNKIGTLLNYFIEEKGLSPQNVRTQNGINAVGFSEVMPEFRVNSTNIWGVLTSQKNLEDQLKIFIKEAKIIIQKFGFNKFTRVGMRTQYIYEFADEKEKTLAEGKLGIIPGYKRTGIEFENDDDLKTKSGIYLVVETSNKENIKGFLLDTDIFIEGEFEYEDVLKKFKNLIDSINDGKILKIVNSIIEK